jgi:hemoglobin
MKTLIALLLLFLVGCAHQPSRSLYDELGGAAGIEALVEQLVQEFAADPRVVPSFRDTEMRRFKRLFAEHLCELSGGPCVYSGASLREAHAHLVIDEALFNAVVEDLQAAMTARGYSQPTQNRVLKRLAPLREEVLSRGRPLPSRLIENSEPRSGLPDAPN